MLNLLKNEKFEIAIKEIALSNEGSLSSHALEERPKSVDSTERVISPNSAPDHEDSSSSRNSAANVSRKSNKLTLRESEVSERNFCTEIFTSIIFSDEYAS